MKEELQGYAALFKPAQLASMQVKNRFVCSATYEVMATETGEVTDGILKRYRNLARGDIGLIIPGMLSVHPMGRAYKHQLSIHDDRMIPGLRSVVESVHQEGGKIVFQLVHAGRQTKKAVIGQTPISPSSRGRDPINFVKPRKMSEEQIGEAVQAFRKAASRAIETGADGVQIHAAHGYLVNQFLSPFFNRRTDGWGGSDEKRFRFLREIVLETRRVLPKGAPILVKLSTNDFTTQEGVTPRLATRYAKWLAEMGIDGLELSCGSALYSSFNVFRGEVPVRELVKALPWWEKHLGRIVLSRMVGKYDLQEGYNLEAAKMIKPAVGQVPVFLVGGLRRVSHMEEILEKGYADFVSMCRPFIREPSLVRRIKEGKTSIAACVSCNMCVAAVLNEMPVRCYAKGLPGKSS
jgi:2,4-dienoyl-CoA reductase-like NADH-dependent reductase (Old Yellow Enzyme family)